MNDTFKATGFGWLALVTLGCASDKPSLAEDTFDASNTGQHTNTEPDQSAEGGNDSDQNTETSNDSAQSSSTTHDDADDTNEPDHNSSTDDTNTLTSNNNGSTADDEATTPGDGPMLGDCPLFPADNAWNTDVSDAPLHVNSDAFIDSIGRETTLHPDFGTEWEGAPIGIPYVVVGAEQQDVEIVYTAYGDESDPGPMPIPADAPIEGGPDGDGDRHTLVVDQDSCTLYELYRAFPAADGFEAESGTVWDLRRNEDHPEGCTSADAAGLPIFPGLARYEEVVERGEVLHALRFTVSRSQRGYVYPARHYASSNTDANLAPMGLRVRMKASYNCDEYTSEVQVLCAAMKRFGMIVADNGSNWYVSGAPDPRWSDDNLRDLKSIPGDAFEVVDTGPVVTDAPDCSL